MAKKVSEREGRLRQISFRTTEDMNRRLLRSASLLGRSLTQEIERRLEASLAQEDYLKKNWGDDVFRIAEAMARSVAHIEQIEGKRWFEDHETYELFLATAPEIVRNYYDLVHETSRTVPFGSFEGRSREELAKMYAALGLSPPRPLPASAPPDPESIGSEAGPTESLLSEKMKRLLAEEPDLAGKTGETRQCPDSSQKRKPRAATGRSKG